MRTKDTTRFVARDLLNITGVPLGSRLAQRLLDVLKPDRSRTPGEAIDIDRSDILKGVLIVQMWGVELATS